MKYDAIVSQGIPIHERVELPEDLIPEDSKVEINAKITAGQYILAFATGSTRIVLIGITPTGYFTAGPKLTEDELKAVQGRVWEEYVFYPIKREIDNSNMLCSVNH